MRFRWILLLACFILPVSCVRHFINPEKIPVSFRLQYTLDGVALQTDTLLYQNDAGNQYSLHHLEYFLSGLTFIKANGETYTCPDIFYINALDSSYRSISLPAVQEGEYTGMRFYIGLSPGQNLSYSLPNTTENVNMAWPDNMGGGYHFMKMEGYTQTPSGVKGYVVHLGKNISLITCTVSHAISIRDGQSNQFPLQMNINEWYRSPLVYDFLTDGNNTMGDSSLMYKIAQNGYNVFSIP